MKPETLTHDRAFAQQRAELLQWRKILSAEAYATLCEVVERSNRTGPTLPGFVFRDEDFTGAVSAMVKNL